MPAMPKVTHLDMISGLSTAVDLVYPALHGHHRRTAFIASQIASALSLQPVEMRTLVVAAMMHDVGALSLAERIETLNFEESETAEPGRDWHGEVGYQLLKGFGPLAGAADLIRFHHVEWWDGRGHSHRGHEVPLASHLLHLADRAAVLVKDGREVLGQAPEIRRRISEQRGRMFVPSLVDGFLQAASKESFWLRIGSLSEESAFFDSLEPVALDPEGIDAFAALFCQIVDFRSRFTATHTSGVGAVAPAMGKLVGLSAEDCGGLKVAGHLHDLGKLAVPVEVLEKPSTLTPRQFNLIKSHSYHTYRLLRASGMGEELTQWAAFHHERLDGRGYPFHRVGEELSLGCRIVAVADVFTALTEDRPYRKGMTKEACLTVLNRMADARALDPDLVALHRTGFDELDGARARGQAAARDRYHAFWDRVGVAVN
jgi:HD-GYP domain-containing protein (c-di-GMP phosphodiesterase class II)